MSDSRHRSSLPRGRELPLREPSPEVHNTNGFVSGIISAASKHFTNVIEYCTGPSELDVERLQIEVQKLREIDGELEERSTELEEEIKRMKEKLLDREDRRDELRRITRKLAVAQRFLSTADSLSQAEVIRAMEGLNEEIFQLTSIVADKVQVEEKKLLSAQDQQVILERSPLLGSLGGFLGIVVPKKLGDTLAIQIGWQAILIHWCFEIIQAWMVEDLCQGGRVNSEMQIIYQGILSESKRINSFGPFTSNLLVYR